MCTRSLRPSRRFPLSLVCVAALAVACSDNSPASDDASETTAMSSTAGDSESSGAMDTTDTSTTSSDETTETSDTNTFIGDEGPDTGMETGGVGNLGDQCTSDTDCAEDLFCNGVPGFGGLCSECASDSDCADGNCTFTGAYFSCGDGSLGQMCESDEVCGDGLFCAEVVNLGGLFNGNFCSECKVDGDCADGQLCAPQIEFMDIMNIAGLRACIDPKSAPNNQLCDANGSGDEQCANFCTTADIMGLIEVGVCGECETDGDCAMGTCTPAMVGLGGFSGSVCG